MAGQAVRAAMFDGHKKAQNTQNFDANFTDGHEFKSTEGNEGNKEFEPRMNADHRRFSSGLRL
jgi:hypothetical protein